VTVPDGSMSLIAPTECQELSGVRQVIEKIIGAENPIRSVHYLDVRQSMRNGGGPACLRLRVVLTARELSLAHQGMFLTDGLYSRLTDWVKRHYRDELGPADLPDPQLAQESWRALDELTQILSLGSLYSFQR